MVDQVVHGLKDLDLDNVTALIFGVTREFNYKDLMLCNILLANPDCLFLLDMPDEDFKARTDSGTVVSLPCNTVNLLGKNGMEHIPQQIVGVSKEKQED